MGKMTKKLQKKIVDNAIGLVTSENNYKQFGVSKETYDGIYYMVRQQLKDEIRNEVMKKLEKNVIPNLKETLRKEVAQEATNDAYGHLIALACNILVNDFGKLNKKSTRLKTFYELLEEKYVEVENPSEQQLEAERELNRQLGRIQLVRE